MKYPDNIWALHAIKPDFIGLIFYERSPRFVDSFIPQEVFPQKSFKVGVFVHSSIHFILECFVLYKLDFVQLYDEDISLYEKLNTQNVKIIKAVSVTEDMDFRILQPFLPSIKFLLFDTKSKSYGGSGQKFDWNILKAYQYPVPFFLSGGLETSDISVIKSLHFKFLYGLDVNSKFEIDYARKDIPKLVEFKDELSR